MESSEVVGTDEARLTIRLLFIIVIFTLIIHSDNIYYVQDVYMLM